MHVYDTPFIVIRITTGGAHRLFSFRISFLLFICCFVSALESPPLSSLYINYCILHAMIWSCHV
ncbi:hypothetical protein BDV25DRAFT_28286 [Aspergillus avenaceus]|uniref:Uncharacterized protein n=1 Tax=Aspergillus avenaceus TaxID=36643 RepID=A0A5N6TN32_ASPAV|nr:hypothetical protein BDV25DRAFT_28286 [Aspergillus avenaceus]